jgi:hypothetical protein
MKLVRLSAVELSKAAGIGIATAVALSMVMLAAIKSGVSPLPEPLGLAFASRLLGRELPLPVGLAFHVAWVTLWSVLNVALFRDALTFPRALGLALFLWLLVLVAFFPYVGWGFLGLAVGPKLIVGALVPHLLFALFLWALARWGFRGSSRSATAPQHAVRRSPS